MNAHTLMAAIFPERDPLRPGLESAIQRELLIEALHYIPTPRTVSELFMRLGPASGFDDELRTALRMAAERHPELSLEQWVGHTNGSAPSGNGRAPQEDP